MWTQEHLGCGARCTAAAWRGMCTWERFMDKRREGKPQVPRCCCVHQLLSQTSVAAARACFTVTVGEAERVSETLWLSGETAARAMSPCAE